MVRIGIVGIGFMGVTHYNAIKKVRGAKVTAIATRDPKKLSGDWRGVQGNFGGPGAKEDLSGINCYSQIEDLLNDPKVDLVDICLPTPLHVESTLAALDAGKHVLLEKPIALSIKDADRLVARAQKQKRQFMVAHVLRFFPEFLLVKEMVRSGELGKVLAADFKRVISRPAWWNPKVVQRTGGPAIDLHIHDVDFVQYLFGMPTAVSSSGYVGKGKLIEHLATHYQFGNKNLAISTQGGWLSQQGCPFEHGYDIFFEEGTLKYNSSWGIPPQLLSKDGKVRKPKLTKRDGFVGELQEAVDAIRTGNPSGILSGKNARNSLLVCLRELESVRRGAKVRI